MGALPPLFPASKWLLGAPPSGRSTSIKSSPLPVLRAKLPLPDEHGPSGALGGFPVKSMTNATGFENGSGKFPGPFFPLSGRLLFPSAGNGVLWGFSFFEAGARIPRLEKIPLRSPLFLRGRPFFFPMPQVELPLSAQNRTRSFPPTKGFFLLRQHGQGLGLRNPPGRNCKLLGRMAPERWPRHGTSASAKK